MPVALIELMHRRRADRALVMTCALSAKIDALNSDRSGPIEVLRMPGRPFRRTFGAPFSPAFFRRLHRVQDSLARQEVM